MSNSNIEQVQACLRSLHIRHLIIRVLIAGNLFFLFLHYTEYNTRQSNLIKSILSNRNTHFSPQRYPAILHEALIALVVDDVTSKRYEVVWDAWPNLKYQDRTYVIDKIARDLEDIEATTLRIDILNQIGKLSQHWRNYFIKAYNHNHLLEPSDPFAKNTYYYKNILNIKEWQIDQELKYMVFIHRYGLDQRHCLLLDAPSNEKFQFCEALRSLYKEYAIYPLGQHMLVIYFMNWPADKPIQVDIGLEKELIKSCILEAHYCLQAFEFHEHADNLLNQFAQYIE